MRQIDVMRRMGMGGFPMHPRVGMRTPYLSDSFMDLVEACTDEAERRGMLAYLYDEDKWPSGYAGGMVTRDPQYRQRYLCFTPEPEHIAGASNAGGAIAQGGTGQGVPPPSAAGSVCSDAGRGWLSHAL